MKNLDTLARDELKTGLKKCTEYQLKMFRRMYSHKDLTLPINTVVDNMDSSKLKFAIDQVIRTIGDK